VLSSTTQTDSRVVITTVDKTLDVQDSTNGEIRAEGSQQSVQARAERAAKQAGVAAVSIERLPFDLSGLEQDGILVNVDTQNFGLLDRRLDWQALGISLPRGTDLAFRPPRCGLVPDRYRLPLLRPAGQAHTALHRFSYSFRLVETILETTAFRWVPWRAWPAFEQAFERTQTQLREALNRYAADYLAIRATVLNTFRQLAADSAQRLAATGQQVSSEFEDAVVREVLASLPTPELLSDRLSLRYRVGILHLGSEILMEQRRTVEARRRLETIESDRRLAQQRHSAEQRLVQEELFSAQERLRQQQRAEEQERQREATIRERLRQLKLEAARERLQETLSPIEEGARQLHAAVFDAASMIRASLQKRGSLHGSSARKARELSRWFRLMAWQGDDQLEALLRDLERLASTPASRRKRDPGSLDQVLNDIVALTYADARALAEPNRMAGLEL
jgi:hypothetical protein